MDFSFSGAGFMGCYYFGVVQCLKQYVPAERVKRAAGASAGSLAATFFLLDDVELDKLFDGFVDMILDFRSRPLGVFDRSNQMVDVLPRLLDRLLPNDAHKRLSGRLFVSITRLKDMKNFIINEYDTRQDLIEALNCSCFIPIWSGNHVATFRGVRHIDGGVTNNLPVFNNHTIRLSCFSGDSDIAPIDRARNELIKASFKGMPFDFTKDNLRRGKRALWPPPHDYLVHLLEEGYKDAKRFILDNDLIQCEPCFKSMDLSDQPVFMNPTPTISPRPSPTISRQASFRDLANLGTDHGPSSDNMNQLAKSNGYLGPQMAGQQIDMTSLNVPSSEVPLKQIINDESKQDSDTKDANGLLMMATDANNNNNNNDTKKSKKSSFSSIIRKKLRRIKSNKKLNVKSSSNSNSPDLDVDVVEQKIIKMIQDEQHTPAAAPQIIVSKEDEQRVSPPGGDEAKQPNSDNDHKNKLQTKKKPARMTMETLAYRRDSQACVISPSERFIAGSAAAVERRSTQADIDVGKLDVMSATLLAGNGKFTSLGELLPSCPPSPVLKRHCHTCKRMRQDARADGMDDLIVQQAEKCRQNSEQADKDNKTDMAPGERMAKNKVKVKRVGPLRWVRQKLGPKELYSFEPTRDPHQRHQIIIQTVAY